MRFDGFCQSSERMDIGCGSKRDLGATGSFPDGAALAWEAVKTDTHHGTHIDAPWHYGPMSEGKPARTIDQLPLEWFIGPGVRLDLRHKPAGATIRNRRRSMS